MCVVMILSLEGPKMPQKNKAYIYVLNTGWVRIEFVNDRCCRGNWRVSSLKSRNCR
uniref:Uncharacterized protein n=1 Tax=Lepeophtheirus salmonis TaxID=72036 RepID=A0A0K2VEP2_LEPSM